MSTLNKERLDLLVMQKYQLSRTQAAKWIDDGYVIHPTGKKVKSGHLFSVEEFTTFKVTIPPIQKTPLLAQAIPLNIIYEDADILVVHKPVGMVVHPASGNLDGTLVNAILHHCQQHLSVIGGVERPGIVHRIDKDTEGLLVVAKNDQAHQFLSKQFEKHTITRKYLALVQGNLVNEQGTITGALGRDPHDRKKIMVVTTGGKNAITHYTVLKRFNTATLVEVTLETGRTHQIRVHFAYKKHPLLGDPVYHPKYYKKKSTQKLIAYQLGFIHPTTKKYLEFTAKLPTWAKYDV